MRFENRESFDRFLDSLVEIGFGSQGVCYLDTKSKMVYKVFHDYFDEEESYYTADDILRFSNIKNSTFIWPNDVIYVGDVVAGYTSSFVKAKSLDKIDPLKINLDKFSLAINSCYKDIKTLTDNNVCMYDVMYNILYSTEKFKIIDTLEYGDGASTYFDNVKGFDYGVKLFLVDNYFDDFVLKNSVLSDMYRDGSVSSLSFLKEFRDYLSTYLDKDINYLSNAKSLVRKTDKPRYVRGIDL